MSASRSWRPAAQHRGPTAADLPYPKRLHSMIRILLRSSLATRDAASSPPRATSRQPLSLFTVPSRWPLLLLLLALLLSAGSAVGLTRLRPDARVDVLIDPNAAAFKDQALFAATFGADPVVAMATPAPGSSLITPDHIVGLSHLEGNLHQAPGVTKLDGPGAQVRHILDIVNGAATSGDLKELHDLRLTASGSPALTLSVADSILSTLVLLVPLALVAVLVVALLALGASMLLTVLVAALGALWTAGIAGFLGLPVTPATLVVLPVVLGLAADYLIQSVNRVMESEGTLEERLALAARRILPTTGVAAAATAAGMLAFVVSGIPLIRQFGLFMALGVVMAYLANYLVGLPLLLLLGRRAPGALKGGGFRAAAGRRLARIGTLPRAAAVSLLVIGLAGWAALPLIKIETDPAQLVPANDAALMQAEAVRKEIGLTGEIDLLVQGADPAAPDAVKWLDQAGRQAAPPPARAPHPPP